MVITDAQARGLFLKTFWATLALKLGLAAWFPMTGDEAFFFQWGVRPGWGYSDHPPMVGWWLAVLHRIGDQPLVLRSLTLLVTSVIALGLVDLARRYLPPERQAAAWLAGAVYLVLPWSWMFVLVTTDTPLVFFMALSAYCFLRAEASGRAAWFAAAGLCVGLAFLSKYFAALLGLAYAFYILGWQRRRWWALPLMFACALPAIALNLVYNATHGWPNILFNFFNRNEDKQWSLASFATYLGMAAYLLTPWLLRQAWRARRVAPAYGRALTLLWLFPLGVFTLLSLRREVGLHWVLGFVPLFVLWCAIRLDPVQLRRSWRWTLGLSLPHLVLVLALVASPLAWWKKSHLYEKLVFLREAEAVTRALEQDLPPGAQLMARAYSPAAILAYFHGRYVPVFGPGRHHARQDDQLVDFRAFEGRPMRIFSPVAAKAEAFAPYFESVAIASFEVRGVSYWRVDGQGFRYAPYRDRVLREAAEHFHRIPPWLPNPRSPFCERYGFDDCLAVPH